MFGPLGYFGIIVSLNFLIYVLCTHEILALPLHIITTRGGHNFESTLIKPLNLIVGWIGLV